MEIEKIIGLASLLLITAAFLIIMNATLPRLAIFTSSRLTNHTFPAFTLQYWLLLAVIIAAAVLAFMWIRREG